MKKIGVLAFLAIFLMSCGAKKRREAMKQRQEVEERASTSRSNPSDDGLYPMPEDTGKFVKFPISSIEEYIDTFSEIAQFEMKAYGIPASITLAQGILESGFGRGELTLKTNNHFGIKCHTGWEGEFDYHDDDEKGECFRKYNHPMYSFRDHSIFLSSRSRYATLFKLRKDDYKGWAKGLRAAGYATDRRYPQKLIGFIERHQLYKYDLEVLGEGYSRRNRPVTNDEVVHTVKKGDTLYSISRKYAVSIADIMELNHLDSSTLAIGQQLTIQSEKVSN